jgi:hypothetical protein
VYILRYQRKKCIIQMEITDYVGQERRVVFQMSVPSERSAGLKAIAPRVGKRPRGRSRGRNAPGSLLTLWDFTISIRKTVIPVQYLLRFPRRVVAPTDLGRAKLTAREAIFYWELPGFRGYFDDLFEAEDFAFWDRWEVELRGRRLPREVPCLRDMFVYECVRLNMGCETYVQFARALGMLGPSPVLPLLYNPTFVPGEQDFSDFYRVTPLDAFQELFWDIVERLYAAKAIRCRVMVWDCQFVHSNSADYKDARDGTYSDRDAGVGWHTNKFLGVGYMVSTLYLYCGDVVAPIFCVPFPANTNDKQIFAETMQYYYSEGWPTPLVILCDRGAYSVANLRLLASHGTIGLVNVPKLVTKQPVAILDDDHRVNRRFVPAEWSDKDLLALMNLRTVIERKFSPNNLVHHGRRLNVREIAEVAKHRYMLLILEALKVLACVNMGRGDLLGRATAFSRLRNTMTVPEASLFLTKAGYTPLTPLVPPSPDINKIGMMQGQGRQKLNER